MTDDDDDDRHKRFRMTVIEKLTGSATASTGWAATHRITQWEQLPSDHPIYGAIGKVASEWAYYELILDDIIRMLVGVEGPLITSVTAQMMGASNRLRAITALCTVRGLNEKILGKINSVQNNTYTPAERRNRIVHDPWFIDSFRNEIAQFKSMPYKDLRYGVKPTEAAFIDDTLKLIEERITEAKKLYEMIYLALHPSPETPPEPPPQSPPEISA